MSHILLKSIIPEAQMYSYTIAELLDKLLEFKGKTLVFLDTETAGREPNVSYLQLTQLSAMAFDGTTMEFLGKFSEKAHIGHSLFKALNDPSSSQAMNIEKTREKYLNRYKTKHPNTGGTDYPDDETILKKAGFMHPRDVLHMTRYHSSPSTMNEADILSNFVDFFKKFPNVVLVIHNATFDMKVIQARLRLNRLPPMQRYPVIDTLRISRYFFIPIIEALEFSDEQAKNFLSQLLAKTKFKSYASSMGRLAAVFDIKIDEWHDAEEDIKILFQLFGKLIEYLKSHKDIDIRKQQGAQAHRLRHMKQ